MNSKLFIAFIVVVILLAVGYWYWYSQDGADTPEEQALKNAESNLNTIMESINQGVLPSLNTETNPLSAAPDVNPVSKTNPFSGLKTNPFSQ